MLSMLPTVFNDFASPRRRCLLLDPRVLFGLKQAVEGHISQHDLAISGTSVAVQNLDQKTLAAFADLRGRVARYRHKASHHSQHCSVSCTKSEQNLCFFPRRKSTFLNKEFR